MIVFGVAVLVLLVTGIYVAVRALQARDHFLALRSDLSRLESAAAGEAPPQQIAALAARARRDATAAHRATNGWLWQAWSTAPRLGVNLRVIRGGAIAADDLVQGASAPMADLAAQLPALRHGATIDVGRLRSFAPVTARADDLVSRALSRVDALPQATMSSVDDFRLQMQSVLARFSRQAHAIAVATRIGPAMLGADGPRRYLVAVQNDAEARATGGIVSAYAVLTADGGRIHLDQVGSDRELPESPQPVVNLGPEFTDRYGDFDAAGDWRNATMTPDGPTAARIVAALWTHLHPAQQLDGVLLVDPLMLADVLSATGPLPGPDGISLTSSNVASLTMVDYYRLYPAKAARSAAFTAATRAVFTAVQNGQGSLPALVERLGHASVTGHLGIWSTRSDEEDQIRTTAVSAALPVQATPFLEVLTQDAGASKLSPYLRREVSYTGTLAPLRTDLGDGRGPQPLEIGRLTLTLRNLAPARGLPAYVYRHDAEAGSDPPGSQKVYVSAYVGRSGVLTGATVGGKPASASSQTEQGMSVFSTTVVVPAGGAVVVTFDLAQPTTPGLKLVYRAQPLAVPEVLHLAQR